MTPRVVVPALLAALVVLLAGCAGAAPAGPVVPIRPVPAGTTTLVAAPAAAPDTSCGDPRVSLTPTPPVPPGGRSGTTSAPGPKSSPPPRPTRPPRSATATCTT